MSELYLEKLVLNMQDILYNSQCRVPAGTPAGGQFSSCDGSSPIAGLPEDIDLNHPSLHALKGAADRGAFNMRVIGEETYGGITTYQIEVKPADTPDHFKKHKHSPRSLTETYYDPDYYELQQHPYDDTGTVKEVTPKPGTMPPVNTFSEPITEPGKIWRGMSHDEFQAAQRTGKIESLGDYNLGEEQAGLTYFTTQKDTAEFYASGFAPWQYKPTVERPAVVVKVSDPGNHVYVAGTGNHEVGLRGSVPFSSVEEVNMGKVVKFDTGMFEVRRDNYSGNVSVGSSYGYTPTIMWGETEAMKHNADTLVPLLVGNIISIVNSQCRVPGGNPAGGQFTSCDGGPTAFSTPTEHGFMLGAGGHPLMTESGYKVIGSNIPAQSGRLADTHPSEGQMKQFLDRTKQAHDAMVETTPAVAQRLERMQERGIMPQLDVRGVFDTIEGSQGQQVGGLYDPPTNTIILPGGALVNGTQKAPIIGQDNFVVDRSLDGAYRHELGHAIYYKDRGVTELSQWPKVIQDAGGYSKLRKSVSEYAGTNADEAFAESFSAYTHPAYGRNPATKLPKPIHDFMEKHYGPKNAREVPPNLDITLQQSPEGAMSTTWMGRFITNLVEIMYGKYDKEKGTPWAVFQDNLLKALYDANQPRDTKGRWVSTGGGASFARAALEGGGFSYQPIAKMSPTSGTMVSLDSKEGYEHAFKMPEDPVEREKAVNKEIKAYIQKHIKVFEDNPDLYCGGWVEESGDFCFDVSQNIPNTTPMRDVVKLAKERNQRGVYNIDTNTYITEDQYDAYLQEG